MNHFIISSTAASVLSSTAAIVIFLLNPSRRINRIFSLYWFSIAFWSFFVATQSYTIRILTSFWWGWFLHLGCIFIPVLFFHFAVVVAKQDSASLGRIISFSYVVAFVFNLLNLFTKTFTSGTAVRDAYSYPIPSVIYPVYFVFFIILVLWGSAFMIKFLLRLPKGNRKVLKVFLFTHALAYFGGMDNFLIMIDVRLPVLYPYGLYPIILYAATSIYVSCRRQLLLDANPVVK